MDTKFSAFSTPNNLHFRHSLNAFSTNFYFLAVDFLGLKIDFEFSSGGDVRMASGVSSLGSSPADLANFRHNNVLAVLNVLSPAKAGLF